MDVTKRLLATLLLLTVFAACVPTPPQPAPATKTDWWKQAVFYEIFVRSFSDSDNDGIGDFNGLTAKLDYLEKLGVTAIWLMPIHPSPSYHGYDVLNYYNVNPEYGTLAGFKHLLDEAHQRGIRVIIDLVLNHTSSGHPFFVAANSDPASPYRDWYIWSETDPGNGWHPGNQGYYFGLFWSGMPDLNYNNPQVTAFMENVVHFWLGRVGVDGFRVDAAKHLIEAGDQWENTPATHAWYREFYRSYKADFPEAYTVGEVFGAGSSVVKSYTGDQLDQVFNFEMSSGFVNSAKGGSNSGLNSALHFAQADMPDFNFATFLTNHDQERVMSVLNNDVEKAKVAAFLLLTSPGTPFIYYGEEIGMQGRKPDEDIRLPMQWSGAENAGFSGGRPWRSPAADYPQVNVAAQMDRPASLLTHYQTLIALRKSHPALQSGDLTILETGSPGVYAALRAKDGEAALILANLSRDEISRYNLSGSGLPLADGTYSTVVLFGRHMTSKLRVEAGKLESYQPVKTLPPFELYILQLQP